MSSRSLVGRRVLWLVTVVAALAGLHAAAGVQYAPSMPALAMPALPDIVVCATEWCPPPEPSPEPISGGGSTSTAPALAFDPSSADVYPSQDFAFVIDNRTSVSVDITDQAGVRVAQIAAGGSATLHAPGAGTYRYTLTSPPSGTPPVLTIIAHDEG